MICRYCVYFDTAKERYKIGENKYKRRCIITNKDKGENDDICDNFLMVTALWCDQNGIRINLNSCMNRHKNKDIDCKRCTQILNLKQYVDEKELKNETL